MSIENSDHEKIRKPEQSRQAPDRNRRSAMIFSMTWALLLGVTVVLRLDSLDSWQTVVQQIAYGTGTFAFLVAFFLFWKGKTRAARVLSLVSYIPQIVLGTLLTGGGSSVLILVLVSSAFILMYGFMVEPRVTRVRFFLLGLLFVAVNLVLFFIPFPFRLIAADENSTGLSFTIAIAIVAFLLILTQARQGVQQFRRSTGFKLGLGFVLTSLITLGFMAFAINVLVRVSVDFDYTRYADFEQIYANKLKAEVRGMANHFNEFMRFYNTEGVEEAYTAYMGEYNQHSSNVADTFSELESLHQEGWGDYLPDMAEASHGEELVALQASLAAYDSLVTDVVDLVNQRGSKETGLDGGLRRATDALNNWVAFEQFPELEVLLLEMRRHEGDWTLRHELSDANSVISFGNQAISMVRSLDIPATDRVTAEYNINSYLAVFNEVVALDQEIDSKQEEARQAFAPINPALADYEQDAVAEVEKAQTRLNATSDYVQNAAIGFGVGALLMAGLVAFVTTRIIVRPITSLTVTANALAEGQLDARSDLKSQDETGVLAGVFNQMADRLQNTLSGLEATVAERTAELQERAKEMEASQRVTFAASERTSPADFLDLLVNLLVDQFDVYHAQVYLVDEARQNAVLSQSTGYAGRVLLQRQHHIPLERESLVTRCINSGQSVLVANTKQESGWLPNDLLPYTESELVVPLTVEGKVIGALDIQDRVADRFSKETVPVFESMTEQVAFLYQNNELLEEIETSRAAQERFAKQLATAAFIANQLGSILELDQLLSQAVSMMQSEFNLYHAHIYLLDQAKENLVVQSGSGHVGVILKERGHSIPVDKEQSLVARSFRDKLPVLVEDVTLAEGHMPNPLLPDTRSELAVPLISRGEVIGVLDIQDEVVGRFTEVDANTMNTLAVQMATAIENAQLFKQASEERERFRVLIDTAPEAIVVFNGETGEFLEANENATKLYELPMKELVGNNPVALSPEFQPGGKTSGEAAMGFIQEAIDGGSPVFNWVHRTGQGNDVDCEIHLTRLPGYDNPPRIRASVIDITERKAAQDTIIEGDKLKSEFLANMSHELRTPLNSIVGYTDVLLMGVDGDLNDEMLTDVQAIQENSQLLLGIINNILDLAKIEAKRVIFEVTEVEVKDMLENVARNNAGLLVNKPVEMKVETAPDLPMVEVDQMRVEQVLNNLVSNAVKFTDEGYITLRAFTEPSWMVMEVEDTGSGIKKEDLQVIFEEFRQADGSQTRTAEGTGLGLTITRNLVHMHSGTIEVSSEVGKGSTFTVRLPLEARISPEVTVKKKAEKKSPQPVLEAVAEPVTAAEKNDKAKSNGNGSKKNGSKPQTDFLKATEAFTDALKEAVEKSGPNVEEDAGKKASDAGDEGK